MEIKKPPDRIRWFCCPVEQRLLIVPRFCHDKIEYPEQVIVCRLWCDTQEQECDVARIRQDELYTAVFHK